MMRARLHPARSGQVAQWPSGQVQNTKPRTSRLRRGLGYLTNWPSGQVQAIRNDDAEGFSPGLFTSDQSPTPSGPEGLGVISPTPSLGHSATRPLDHFGASFGHFRFAFTIVELLVVLALMAVLVTLAWPTLRNLTGSNRIESAVNSVSVAAKAMRTLAPRPFLSASEEVTNAAYDGTAMVFIREPGTLDLRIRLTYNNQHAQRSVGAIRFLESMLPGPPDYGPRNGFTDLHGFTDFGVPDPIRIPNGMAVAGIIAPTTATPHLADLPFAVRYSYPNGHLLALSPDAPTGATGTDQRTYYDYLGKTVNVGGGRSYQLPDGFFNNNEALTNAIGVVVYDMAKARAAGLFRDPANNDPIRVPYQLLVNGSDEVTVTLEQLVSDADGRVIFFSRYSGAAVMEGAQR